MAYISIELTANTINTLSNVMSFNWVTIWLISLCLGKSELEKVILVSPSTPYLTSLTPLHSTWQLHYARPFLAFFIVFSFYQVIIIMSSYIITIIIIWSSFDQVLIYRTTLLYLIPEAITRSPCLGLTVLQNIFFLFAEFPWVRSRCPSEKVTNLLQN